MHYKTVKKNKGNTSPKKKVNTVYRLKLSQYNIPAI